MSCKKQDDYLSETSENSQESLSLNGCSPREIEETALARAQEVLTDMDMAHEAQLLAARVYGSRSRDGLCRADSDVDIVLSYSGNIREDDFFNALHEESEVFFGLEFDINPISLEKTGTLAAYMEKAEKYLDEKQQKQRKPSIRERLKKEKPVAPQQHHTIPKRRDNYYEL